MNLLDSLTGELGKMLGSEDKNSLLEHAMRLLNNPASGGLTGLVQAFKDKGLGDAVISWISAGENQPVSGEQIQHVLGKEQIQELAAKLGISIEEISDGLATLLPQLIDKLTPRGSIPDQNALTQGIDALEKKIMNS